MGYSVACRLNAPAGDSLVEKFFYRLQFSSVVGSIGYSTTSHH